MDTVQFEAQASVTPQAYGWQKILQHIAALAPVSWLLARTLHYVDRPLLKFSNGKVCLASIVTGLPLVMLTTIGAKTGQPRTTPLVGLVDGDKVILIASYYGSAHHPAWYHNLRAHPEAQLTRQGRTQTYLACEVNGDAYARYWQLAVETYAGYAAYKQRAGARHIPIIVLTQQ
jgi:deazaflavin-dependent oxidoreductase (nitroreductase family)